MQQDDYIPDPAQREAPGRSRFFYGWWMVLLAGLVMIVATVPLHHALPVWGVALERYFGWTRFQLGMALTITRLVGLVDPVFGYIADRFGPRRTVLTGLCILGAGTVLFGLTRNLLGFYVAFAVMAVGSSLCGNIPLLVLLCRWFVRHRATAIAIFLTAPSLGALVLVPVIALSVDLDYALPGWRLTVFALAGLTLIAAIPVLALLRNQPQDVGLLPHGVPQAVQSNSFSINRTLRAPAFWLIALGDALTSMAAIFIVFYMGQLMTDMGYSVQAVSWVVAAYTLASMVFQVVGGVLGDRMSKRRILALFASIQAAGVLGLVVADSLALFLVFAVLVGAGSGGRGVLSIAILPDYFGTASLGKILGFSFIFGSLTLLITTSIGGLMVDGLGGYAIPLIILAALNLLGAFMFLNARSPQPPSWQVTQATPA